MSSARCLFLVAVVWTVPALAEAPWVSASSRLESRPRVEGWAGIPEVGAGYLVPSGWSGELAYAPGHAFLEVRGGKGFSLVRWERYGLAAQVGVSGLGTVKGPFDF